MRIELSTQTHKALLYSASDIDVLDENQLLTHPFLSRVGPDILDRTRGVTVAPALAGKLQADGLTYEAYRFYVFGREGLPCHRCDSPIERHTMGSRNLFACPSCQTRELSYE